MRKTYTSTILSFIFLLLLAACQVESVSKGTSVSNKETWKPYTHYYSSNPSRLLFKTSLQISSERFSGLLIVKQLNVGEYRSVFTTETGFKVFDFTIKNDGYLINYAVGATEDKMVADRLVFTIQAALLRGFIPDFYTIYCPGAFCLQSYVYGKYVYEIKRTGDSKYVESQSIYKGGKKKAEAIFYGTQDNSIPDSSVVNNIGFPLQASFRLLEQ